MPLSTKGTIRTPLLWSAAVVGMSVSCLLHRPMAGKLVIRQVTCHTDVLLLCSAARALARKLAEEKQAAINAAKNAVEHSMDEEELEAIKQSVEQATADAAREAARADALARAACQQGPSASSHLQDLERLKVCKLSPSDCSVAAVLSAFHIFSGNQA